MSLLRKTHLRLLRPLSNDNDDYYVDDDVTFGRNLRSRDFGKIIHEDIDLSDHVKFRLWLARQLALKKYTEIWG